MSSTKSFRMASPLRRSMSPGTTRVAPRASRSPRSPVRAANRLYDSPSTPSNKPTRKASPDNRAKSPAKARTRKRAVQKKQTKRKNPWLVYQQKWLKEHGKTKDWMKKAAKDYQKEKKSQEKKKPATKRKTTNKKTTRKTTKRKATKRKVTKKK